MEYKSRLSGTELVWGLFLVCIAFLFVAAQKNPSKQIPPEVFSEWEIKKILSPRRVLAIIVTNPDTTSLVRTVAMVVRPSDMTLASYRYFEDGTPRLFARSYETEKFDEVKLTSEQTEQCFGCHRDGRFTREMSAGDAGREARARGIGE